MRGQSVFQLQSISANGGSFVDGSIRVRDNKQVAVGFWLPKVEPTFVDSTLAFTSRLLFSLIGASEKRACLSDEVAGCRLGSRRMGSLPIRQWYGR